MSLRRYQEFTIAGDIARIEEFCDEPDTPSEGDE